MASNAELCYTTARPGGGQTPPSSAPACMHESRLSRPQMA
eukprot:CAMPEP_0183347830 /NCGR_PEP_ID=MMETSP0164_2-20130417/12529_1 /TAXON_ID=221442 /ORGANISM="Coccolithus pelagicus ssp braarudi, Strain PLY182g" /LENGTH=39 /DNA_ID= /DNA_START= /DNA_END= /DNA_ORIENTATION=